MILPDFLIKSENELHDIGLEEACIGPASADLRLGSAFISPDGKDMRTVPPGEDFILQPGECVLARTKERVYIPPHLCAQVMGRSSVGRLFVLVHVTAGYIDPGFDGTITLEMKNIGNKPVSLTVGSRVCQLVLMELKQPCHVPYNGRYQNQVEPTESRYYYDNKEEQQDSEAELQGD